MSPHNGTISPIRVLLLEDNPADAALVIAELRRGGLLLEVKTVETKAAYLECLNSSFDAIISDYDLPQFNAREALVLLQAGKFDIPFIVVSGTMGEETAVELIKLGAADYLLKDRLARLPQALVHAVEDHTLRRERTNAQEDLRRSQERMREILDSALDAVITMNHDGEIVDLNPASVKIFGHTRAEAIGKRLVDLIIPQRFREDHNRGLALYLHTGEARMLGRRAEVIALKKDGSEFPAEMAVTRIGSGEPPMFTAFLRDVGDKRRAEEAVRVQANMLDRIGQAVIATDSGGTIIYANRAAGALYGWARGELLGREIMEVIVPQTSQDQGAEIRARLQKGENWSGEFLVQNRTGRVFPASVTNSPLLDERGELVGIVGISGDITARKQAEEAMRDREREQRALASQLEIQRGRLVAAQAIGKVGSWETDLSTQTVIWSEETYRIFEIGPDEFKQSHQAFLDFVHPDDRAMVEEAFARSMGQADGQTVEHRILLPNGRIKFIEERWQCFADDSGRPQRAIGTCQDITERKHAEDARREADAHLITIINSVDGIVWETDEETNRMTFISEKAEEILGYPTARWLAEPGFWRSHMHPDDLEKTIADSNATNGHSEPRELEYRMLSATGQEVWFKDRVSVVNVPGRTVKQRGIMLDITERRRAEEIARAGEAQIREQARLLDLAQDAIMVRDMEDRVAYWNHGAEQLYGWTAAEAAGKAGSALVWKGDPAGATTRRTATLENGHWTGECKHSCKDGGHVTVRSRWTLLRDESGAPKSFLIINTDITEQKKIEQQFMRAQRLESIGTLASGVAHDLNNILAPILMGAAVLRRSEMPAADEMILSTIETCAQRGADIVKQVLTFARGAEGAQLLLQPAHLINDMAKIAEGTFPKSITVRTNYLEALWPVEGDPTQLHQILLNLCVNARDAMPAGGTLSLSATNFPVDENYASMTLGAKAGPYVLFEVKDSGMGIPRHIIDQIFDPFFTTKEVGLGTGLGLSTVVGIVNGHGGFLTVESEIGRGTSFRVYLPARVDALTTASESEPIALPRAQGELLLLVDDEKLILKVAGELLERHGYTVVTALDAPEALAIFAARQEEIKVVLTDLAMPLMDGIALIRTLQKMKPDVCIIASTGKGSLEQGLHELPGLKVRACLTKPYNKQMLLSTLHSALGHRNGIS